MLAQLFPPLQRNHLARKPKEWVAVAFTQRREKRKTGQAEERFSLNFLECRAMLPSQARGEKG